MRLAAFRVAVHDASFPLEALSLCKLHHAPCDRMFLALRPDDRMDVRRDVPGEEDGPMLIHDL